MNKEEPKGIGFTDLKSGDMLYAKLEPQIQGFINSSDMGINASRGQDFKWRLAPEWVKAVKAFRQDEFKMDTLSAKLRLEDGVAPNLTQILFAIYGAQIRAYKQRVQGEETPFEDQYLKDISGNTPDTSNDDKEEALVPAEASQPQKAPKK